MFFLLYCCFNDANFPPCGINKGFDVCYECSRVRVLNPDVDSDTRY